MSGWLLLPEEEGIETPLARIIKGRKLFQKTVLAHGLQKIGSFFNPFKKLLCNSLNGLKKEPKIPCRRQRTDF